MYWDLTNQFNSIVELQSPELQKKLQEIYEYAVYAHKWQKRKSWEDYIVHPISVAINLWNKFQDFDLVCAWLLHDSVEDNDSIFISDIYEKFWYDIAFLVDSVTKNSKNLYGTELSFERKMDKLMYAGMKDVRCFLLKLADREDNLKTLGNLKAHKQVRMAFETQAIFTPLEIILKFPRLNSILESRKNLESYLVREWIETHNELKDSLIRQTYTHFTDECFETVYQNSNNVTWQINDRNMLDELLQSPNIDEKIEAISMESWENGHFIFQFKFKKWEVLNKKIPLEIGNTYSFGKY